MVRAVVRGFKKEASHMGYPIEFVKCSGAGNDFICIDGRNGRFEEFFSAGAGAGELARRLCDRHVGVGGDGVIFACESGTEELADIAARFFEADGTETELCGNGSACFVHWVVHKRMVEQTEVRILTLAGVVRGQNGVDGYVRVCIPLPKDEQSNVAIEVEGSRLKCDYIVTGVPHLITYVENAEAVDIEHLGPALRHHERFAPRGVNANFVEVLGEGELAVRTYEFGVEGETLACGTGSAAAAILAAKRFGWDRKYLDGEEPIRVRARGGDILKVYVTMDSDGTVTDLCLETVVRFVYSGTTHPDLSG